MKLGTGLALAAVVAATAYAETPEAAESPAGAEAVQASCIHDAMVRGVVGERLKGYVDACVRAKGATPLPDVKPQSGDTPAC